MRARYTPESYIKEKNDVLTRILRLTEDIYSGVKAPETLESLLDRRMETIDELQRLEHDAADAKKACPEKALAELDSKLRLILNLDAKIENDMTDAKAGLFDSMKSNAMEQKFIKYEIVGEPEKGRLLDEKQ
ncbi:MAG: hypothetical protein LBK57_10830 [Clostridiales Family XIII bacterium]|jgi:hypothetical protein|nr:hypothetical protein [Clostridiales Family XIII bacterium]